MASAPAGQAGLQWKGGKQQIGLKGVSAKTRGPLAEEERATLGEEACDARGDVRRERKGPGLRFRAPLFFATIDAPRGPVIKSDTAPPPRGAKILFFPRLPHLQWTRRNAASVRFPHFCVGQTLASTEDSKALRNVSVRALTFTKRWPRN